MPTTKQVRRPPAKSRAQVDGKAEATLERLNGSLNAAQDAAKLLRKDVRRGTRDIAKDVETMIAATRKDAGKLAKAVRKDLAEFEKAVSSPPRRGRAKAGPTRTRKTAPTAPRGAKR